jgi:hypothetical protein
MMIIAHTLRRVKRLSKLKRPSRCILECLPHLQDWALPNMQMTRDLYCTTRNLTAVATRFLSDHTENKTPALLLRHLTPLSWSISRKVQ